RGGSASRVPAPPRRSATRPAAGRPGRPRARSRAGTSCRPAPACGTARGPSKRIVPRATRAVAASPASPSRGLAQPVAPALVPFAAMAKIGYAAMLEQFHPTDLLDWCAEAEAAGFQAGFMVSEHFHPWTPQQGQAAFAWSFMGALGQRTSLPFGTAVTFPGFRYHPAVVAHAAATLGAMYPGRFWLGLGAGEALNEHILGLEWPEVNVRSEMLFESIEIISKMFEGGVVKHRGKHFRLESAKLYTRPDEPVPIYVATSGPVNAKKTGR